MIYDLSYAEIMSLAFAFIGANRIVDKLLSIKHDNDIMLGLTNIIMAIAIWYVFIR